MRDDGGPVHDTAPVGPAAALDSKPRVSLELRSLLPYPNSCLGTSPHPHSGHRPRQNSAAQRPPAAVSCAILSVRSTGGIGQ